MIAMGPQGEALTLHGHGAQTRSCSVVNDSIEGLVRLGTLELASDGPISLGNEREVTIAQIADMVLGDYESSNGVERLQLSQDNVAAPPGQSGQEAATYHSGSGDPGMGGDRAT